MLDQDPVIIPVTGVFSLRATCGPVHWGKGRWPNAEWSNGGLTWVGFDDGQIAIRRVRQTEPTSIVVSGPRSLKHDTSWAESILATMRTMPAFADDIISELAGRFPGLRPYSSGSLFDGIVSCIAGQSISVAAAAVTESRLCALFHPGVEVGGRRFWPMPTAENLWNAEPALVRQSGVTWKRAEAIVEVGRRVKAGTFPSNDDARNDPLAVSQRLRSLPLVGEWTARSALLWGVGADDAYPPNDVALLRAAKASYARPELTLKELDAIATGWAPARSWAARLLWTGLLGLPVDLTIETQ